MRRRALLEWPSVCAWLARGEGVLIVRAGGIHERGGGGFQLEESRFALVPSRVHEDNTRLRVSVSPLDPVDCEPRRVHLRAAVHGAWLLTRAEDLERLAPYTAYTRSELASRLSYRGALHVLALRVERLERPWLLPEGPEVAGCRSWLPLSMVQEVDAFATPASPVLDEAAWIAACGAGAAVTADLEPLPIPAHPMSAPAP
jgi:hypothetical protein